jgi:hypothetical protein
VHRQERLVRGDDGLAREDRGADERERRFHAAHQLHHNVDDGVAGKRVEVIRAPDGVRQVDAARAFGVPDADGSENRWRDASLGDARTPLLVEEARGYRPADIPEAEQRDTERLV